MLNINIPYIKQFYCGLSGNEKRSLGQTGRKMGYDRKDRGTIGSVHYTIGLIVRELLSASHSIM